MSDHLTSALNYINDNGNVIEHLELIIQTFYRSHRNNAISFISYEMMDIFYDEDTAIEFATELINAWISNINNNQIPFVDLYIETCNTIL